MLIHRNIQLGLSLLLLVGALGYVLSQAETSGMLIVAAQISTWLLFNVVVILFAGCLLAALRFQRVASDLGYRLGFRDAAAIYAAGQLAGVLFFQLPGQLLARGAMLAQRAVPASGTIVITGYERLCSLIVSLVLAVLSAVYLFGQIHLDLVSGGADFIKIALGLVVAVIGGALIGWGRSALNLAPLLAGIDLRLFLRTLALSLLIQLATMAGYIVLVMSIVDNVSVLSLAAASGLIMLAASLPISFAGWGVREMSAMAALGAVGVSVQVSFVVAVLMGVISIAVIGLLLPLGRRGEAQPVTTSRSSPAPTIDYTAILSIALPLAAATAVFFQIFVPIHSGVLNVNLADPIVLLAGAFFIIQHLHSWPEWRVPGFNRLAVAATAVLLLAYLHGLLSFGWSDWAFSNKMLGWFVLLGYGATGALIVRHAGEQGLELLLKTFVGVAVSIVFLEIAILIAQGFNLSWLQSIDTLRMAGLSQNTNAFAFILVLASCVALASQWPRRAILLGVLLFGIGCSGSRTAYLAVPAMLLVALYMRTLSWQVLAKAAGTAVLLQVFIVVASGISWSGSDATGISALLVAVPEMSRPSSDHERWLTISGGWKMFLSRPFFGAGLGAYMEQQLREEGRALVIHSVPIWLLAEMGLAGFLVMAAPILTIFAREARRQNKDNAGIILVLIITVFAVFGLFHDVMYQRGFWLLLGAALASQGAFGSPNNRNLRPKPGASPKGQAA